MLQFQTEKIIYTIINKFRHTGFLLDKEPNQNAGWTEDKLDKIIASLEYYSRKFLRQRV
jgi:hypothetical protein